MPGRIAQRRERDTGRHLPRAGKRASGSVESAAHPFDNARGVPIMGQAALREEHRVAPSRESCSNVVDVKENCKKEADGGALKRTYVLWEEGTGGYGLRACEPFVC